MKKDIHPELYDICFRDVASGKNFFSRGALSKGDIKGLKKETVEGKERYIMICDVTADTHPVYTGVKRFIGGKESQIEKFKEKFGTRRRPGQ